MMPEKNAKDLKNVLSKVLKKYGLENDINYERLFTDWKSIVGKSIAKQCIPKRVEDGVLIIEVKNSIWKHELALKHLELKKLITKELNSNFIKKVKFI